MAGVDGPDAASESSESKWVDVCALQDLPAGRGVCALLGDAQVALFYLPVDEAVYAVQNFDPIGKANVLSRGVVGDVKGQVVVASPLYKQHFNLVTGQCLEKENVRIETYPVRVVHGRVLVGRR